MVRILICETLEHNVVDIEMKRLQSARISGEISDIVLFLEHSEIVTIGPKARKEGVQVPEQFKTAPVDRGGGLTWHGPGQLVVYPIIQWGDDGEANVAEIIYRLEDWIILALQRLGLMGTRDERMQGVWIEGNKIASIGLSFLKWVSRHGFTINLNTPVGRVEQLAGCGLTPSTTTSLQALGYSISRYEMQNALIETTEAALHRSLDEVREQGESPLF